MKNDPELKNKYRNREFLCGRYYVNTAEKDTKKDSRVHFKNSWKRTGLEYSWRWKFTKNLFMSNK